MSTAQFQVIFDGPSVKDGEIDVRELSASLAALNQLFEEADTLLNGGRTSHRLRVRGSFKTGSFKVVLASQQSVLDAAKSWLVSDDGTAIANAQSLAEIIIFGGVGVASLVGVLKWLKGRSVTKILQTDDKTFTVYSGTQYIKTEERVIQLYNDFKVRQAFEAAIADPLKEGKIESVAFTADEGKTFVEATVAEKTYFAKIPEQSTALAPQRYEMNVSLVRLSFESNKWAVYDGTHTLNVDVEDAEFLARTNRDEEAFRKGDILLVVMRIDQSETSTGLKAKHTIEKVLEHRPPMYRGQLRLDVDQQQNPPGTHLTVRREP